MLEPSLHFPPPWGDTSGFASCRETIRALRCSAGAVVDPVQQATRNQVFSPEEPLLVTTCSSVMFGEGSAACQGCRRSVRSASRPGNPR